MRWKTPITLLVLLGVLFGAAFYGWRTVISPASGSDNDSTSGHGTHSQHHGGAGCANKQTSHNSRKIRSKDILVNVYNAGDVTGLAGQTLYSLGRQGFRQGAADNAPSGVHATSVTILTRDRQSPEVQLVASQFKGPVAYARGPALAAGIDVVVGNSFAGMNRSAKTSLKPGSLGTC